MYKNCAISIGGEVAPEARVAIAQAANDLLRIQAWTPALWQCRWATA